MVWDARGPGLPRCFRGVLFVRRLSLTLTLTLVLTLTLTLPLTLTLTLNPARTVPVRAEPDFVWLRSPVARAS